MVASTQHHWGWSIMSGIQGGPSINGSMMLSDAFENAVIALNGLYNECVDEFYFRNGHKQIFDIISEALTEVHSRIHTI